MGKSKADRLSELYRRRVELLEEERVLALKGEEYRERNRIEFFRPIGEREGEEPYQTRVLEYLHAGKKVIVLVGGNGIGKTLMGVVIVGAACLGIQPWDRRVLPPPLHKVPVKVRIICSDWEKHAATVIVPKLKEWLPVGQYETAKNNVGVESVFTFRNGSTLEMITNKQATGDHAGWEGQLVWGDEPFDRDKFIENLRGLRNPVERGGMGIFLITMTAVSASWVLDDIVRNPDSAYASVCGIQQDANPYLTEDYKRIYRAPMNEKEKVARIYGGWLNLVGLVWPGFSKDVHIIDSFEVPTDWPVVAMVDYHPSHEIAIGYYAVDPWDRIYVVDETYAHMSPEMVADDILRHRSKNAWRMKEVFIDPLSKGDMAYVKNRGLDVPDTFTVLKERLWKHGIDLYVASKDKDSGIRNVEKMLEGPNKTPTLFFFRSLDKIEKEGHIWEIQRWTYGDDDKPIDKDDHFMECLYRMTLTGMKYTKLRLGDTDLKVEMDFNPLASDYGRGGYAVI